jgi:Uncharacterised conserved protein (DUF2228)
VSPGSDRRALLRRLYGFDFPDDFFEFWDFARRARPLEPSGALTEATGAHLVGPFDVLAGRLDDRSPRLPMTLHWRYYDDPPELFTVLKCDRGGLHWGYYLDDPATRSGCVASYCTDGAFEIAADGDDLFEAVRLDLERHYRDCEELREHEPGQVYEYEMQMRHIDDVRSLLGRWRTGDRPEIGQAYEEKYPERASRAARVIAPTREGMGIVVPAGTYRQLSVPNKKLWSRLRARADPVELLEEARQALREGFPGTALKLGKDLWALGNGVRALRAFELLDAAYLALERQALRDVLQSHIAHRNLPSVDILADEGLENQ